MDNDRLPPAPQHRLADLRDWLMSRIDGSEETRGEDSLISDFIRQIDALPSEIEEPRGCPTPGACSAVAEQTRLRQMAEHERDGMLEQLIAAQSATAAPVAWMADDGRIVSAATKETSMPRAAKVSFTIPLYTHSASSQEQPLYAGCHHDASQPSPTTREQP